MSGFFMPLHVARIAHRSVADFVRSRAVAAGYGQNSHESCYTRCRAFAGSGVQSGLAVLFADQHAIRNVMRGMHHRQQGFDSSGLTTARLVFCLFFVTAWGVARLFGGGDGRSNTNSKRALFTELCRAHRLSRRDWWLLMRLARHHRLSEPARIFLEPRWLDPAGCGAAWQRHASRLCELQGALFAGLASPRVA